MSIPRHFTVTVTDSVDYHVFFELRKREPQKGDYVRLQLFDSSVGCKPCSIVKRVACVPGEMLKEQASHFFCNDVFLGQALSNKHSVFKFFGPVPDGVVFLIGDQGSSYDSRYFGLKPISDIETVLFPLF
jgi:conjugal transfer pilin signal peptidase TrbI